VAIGALIARDRMWDIAAGTDDRRGRRRGWRRQAWLSAPWSVVVPVRGLPCNPGAVGHSFLFNELAVTDS
jgi:hypothetical protein